MKPRQEVRKMRSVKRAAKLSVAGLAIVVLGGCAAQVRQHGYVPEEADLQQIVPGVDTRATVEDLVGVPTSAGVLNDSGFYYIQSQVRHYGWNRPEVIDREVVAVSFDSAGVVENITTYGWEDGKVVALNRRVTKSGDGEISFIRKLFGNIGGLSLSGLTGN
jgi:outer membrane protein assembly factor BamE (lipoprotein component of BamABCDE complex)